MVLDLELFERALADAHDGLDHRFLDDVSNLGPATLENLSAWIWKKVSPVWLAATRVRTASGSKVSRATVSPDITAARDRVLGIPSSSLR